MILIVDHSGECWRMSWEWLHGVEESSNVLHQLSHRRARVISSHVVMEVLPQPLNGSDPGTVGGRKSSSNFGFKANHRIVLDTSMGFVVVDDKHDAPSAPINASRGPQQGEEQDGVFARMLDPYHSPGVCVQGAGDIALTIPSRGGTAS